MRIFIIGKIQKLLEEKADKIKTDFEVSNVKNY